MKWKPNVPCVSGAGYSGTAACSSSHQHLSPTGAPRAQPEAKYSLELRGLAGNMRAHVLEENSTWAGTEEWERDSTTPGRSNNSLDTVTWCMCVFMTEHWPLAQSAQWMATPRSHLKKLPAALKPFSFLYHNTIERFIILTGPAHALLSKTSA